MKDFWKTLKVVLYCLYFSPLVIGLLMIATGNGNDSSSDSGYHSSRPYNRYQNEQRRERERLEKQRQELQLKEMQQNAQRYQSMPVYTQPSYSSGGSGTHRGTPRENYRILWEECEDLEAILDDHNIVHERRSYPMDYHDLEDLRDEYQSLLEDNDIDY